MIYIGADHRGFELKAKINKWLAGREYDFEDMGAFEYDNSDDYVDYAIAVAQKVAVSAEKHWGIIICGSGVGMSVTANKVRGIRAGLGFAPDQVHAARKSDNINVLVLPADNIGEVEMLALIEEFLTTEFVKSDNYLRREEKITRYEDENFHSKRS
jgi:ribose 5-phosphate isomerase B